MRNTTSLEKTKARIRIVIISCLLFALCGAGVLALSIPFFKYHHAMELLEDDNVTEAIETFESLNNFKDSKQQVYLAKAREAFIKNDVEQGVYLALKGDAKIRVSYDGDGTISKRADNFYSGKPYSFAKAKLEGYRHKGWDVLDYSFKDKNHTIDLDLYTNYVANQYDVYIKTFSEDEHFTFTYNEPYELPIQHKDGYIFVGYTYNDKVVPASGIWNVVPNDPNDTKITLYTSFAPEEYNLSFDFSEIGESYLAPKTVKFGDYYSFPLPYKPGYSFDYYYLVETGDTIPFLGYWNIDLVDGETYHLVPHLIAKSYTVNLNYSGGTGSPNSIKVTFGEHYELPIPTKLGFEFVGWQCPNGDIIPNSGTWNIDDINVLTALWDVKYYEIKFISSVTGEYIPSSLFYLGYGMPYDISSFDVPNLSEYEFVGLYVGNTKINTTGIWNYDTNEILVKYQEIN